MRQRRAYAAIREAHEETGYGRRFTGKHELVQMIQQYIRYYTTRRVQRNLGVLTPMEKHARCLAA